MRCKAKLSGKQRRQCIREAREGGLCTQHGKDLARLRDEAQAARLAHKEEAKGREVVDCVMRVIVVKPTVSKPMVIEAALQCTRNELAIIQKAHAKDCLIINYIMEDKA